MCLEYSQKDWRFSLSSSVKDFNRAGISKLLDFKPEILIKFNLTYIPCLMTHCRFHFNLEILIDFNAYLPQLNSIKILMKTKLKDYVADRLSKILTDKRKCCFVSRTNSFLSIHSKTNTKRNFFREVVPFYWKKNNRKHW